MAKLLARFGLVNSHRLCVLQKPVYGFSKNCLFSSSSSTPQHLPTNIIFRPAVVKSSCSPSSSSQQKPSPPPLVLVFGWMSAKDTHLEKYRHFWTTRGYDVITVSTEPKSLVMPYSKGTGTVAYTNELVKYLSSEKQSPPYERIIFHNFSVGTYVSSIFRYQLNKAIENGKNPNAKCVREAFKGLVLDSVTFLEDSPRGTAVAATSSLPLQLLIQLTMISYYLLALPLTLSQYVPVSRVLKSNDLPAVILYSLDDEMTSTKRIKKLISHWKSRGVVVREKCWPSSDHVQHFRIHNQEYVAEVEAFLKSIGMPH